MTNAQSMTNYQMTNDNSDVVLGIGVWDLIGHWELVIGH